jgi:hypothetical protein
MRIKTLRPRTILRIIRLWPHARKRGHEIGQLYRVGYYTPKHGLDSVWLVDSLGNYNWWADHAWIEKHFEIVQDSKETSYYGRNRPILGERRQREYVPVFLKQRTKLEDSVIETQSRPRERRFQSRTLTRFAWGTSPRVPLLPIHCRIKSISERTKVHKEELTSCLWSPLAVVGVVAEEQRCCLYPQ